MNSWKQKIINKIIYERRWIFSVLIILDFILLIYISYNAALTNPRIKNAILLATTIRPETFTELYFQNHTGLPVTVVAHKQYNFAFTINNLENQDMNYPYEVYIKENGSKETIDKNSVSIKNNASITIQEGFILDHEIKKSEVIINLINKNQQVDFWIVGK